MQQRARLTVCRNAASATEAQELMAMLGIIDGPDTPKRKPGTCPACGKDLPIEAHSPKWGTAGYCSRSCRNRQKPATQPQTVSATRAREWLIELRKVTTLKAVSEACGVSRASLSGIATGTTAKILPATEQAILAVSGTSKAGAA